MRQIPTDSPRRPVNLTIRADLMAEAKVLRLNASQAAEAGIAAAVKKAKEAAWLEENKAYFDAHNARVEENGLMLTPGWAKED